MFNMSHGMNVQLKSYVFFFPTALFQNEEDNEDESDDDDEDYDDDDDDDSGTDHFNSEKSGTQLQRCERHGGENSSLPDTFQTSHLLFYERFKAYQDYVLGNHTHTHTHTTYSDSNTL